MTEQQIVPFGRLARDTDTVVRFIEFMPLDADSKWQRDKVLFAQEIIDTLQAEFGSIIQQEVGSIQKVDEKVATFDANAALKQGVQDTAKVYGQATSTGLGYVGEKAGGLISEDAAAIAKAELKSLSTW